MSESESILQARIHYYAREKFYHAMEQAALNGLKKYPGDAVYRFYYGLSLVLEERVQEGIRELDSIQDNNDVILGSVLAMIYAHRKCKVVDREAVNHLDNKLKEKRKQASDKGLYYAGVFLSFAGRHDKAKDYVDRMLKIVPNSKEGLLMKGWIEIALAKGKTTLNIISYFERAGNDPDALFGKSKCLERDGNLAKALEILNQAVVIFPRFVPALIEKMKIQLSMKDWDQALDSANRILSQEKNNIEAQRYLILYSLCREGDHNQAAEKLVELLHIFDISEPKNALLRYESARLFSKICGRQNKILQHTYALAEKAADLDTLNADYVTELGHQCLFQGKLRESMKFYRNASKLDESSVDALLGVIHCQILEGQMEAASQQLELLKEIHKSTGLTPEMLFLSGFISQKEGKNPEEVMGYLNECVDKHLSITERMPFSFSYFEFLDPDFLLLILDIYLHYVPDQPITSGQPMPPALKRCQSILHSVISVCPGLQKASFLLGKLKYLAGDIPAAQGILQRCLEQDASFSDARLLLAQILLHQGNFQSANQALEVALSYNFEIRDHIQFHLIKARIQKEQKQFEEALKTLQAGMIVAGIKATSANKKKPKQEISVNDKVSLYLEIADTHRQLDQQHEAAKIMQDAINEFHGTPEEVRITVANADLALARGDVELALNVLRNIGSDQPYYLQAREKMADIYLNHRKDRRLFASCYREVVEKFPTVQSYLMLGDAYMNIQEPERAIEVYEQALKKNPRDSVLARKIGQALIKTHHYEKAVTYYKAAIKTSGQIMLRHDLAHLLFRMKRYKEAQDIITNVLETEQQSNDLSWLEWEAKFLLLLAQIHQNTKAEDRAIPYLQRAWEVQTRVMRRVTVEQPDTVMEQKQLIIKICHQLAEHWSSKKDFNQAMKYYKEALAYDNDNTELLLALAKLEMSANNLEAARQYCTTILKNDKENDGATLMMADLMFRKTDLESAMFHFQQLLDRKPNYYSALARYVECVRRLGKLEDVPQYLNKAEQFSFRSSMDPGFHYCKGLYEWYIGNTTGAMKCFNKARYDSEWGQIATYHMIEICVNPDNETLGGETFESNTADYDEIDSQEAAVRTAEKLLNELKSKTGYSNLDYRIMSNFVLLARKQKHDAEIALNNLMQIASEEKDKEHVGLVLGMATAYMILKQTPRARNQLKRVAKNTWNFTDAEYLEKCWLLLADIFIQSGKYDMSMELLKRILQYNKSSTKAYEYMGFIMEKEQSFKDAAHYYEMTWKQGNHSNPTIGYKLAFNYMKAKRYVDAIDVCLAVLAKYPNYPKIRKEILEKSRSNLRI
ncbi:tetratricopeptide repeat protein 21B-like [Centruroides sculpturatus]|uniref:tetratricopeptide repeat protein 21B-like n=1 Tax=Centruroides sculpturatus TaxID=218467 RepID=UPI000C6CB730|nr:tetratricopeptide repeat protein 21B-like [Centruroides sculpturatus]